MKHVACCAAETSVGSVRIGELSLLAASSYKHVEWLVLPFRELAFVYCTCKYDVVLMKVYVLLFSILCVYCFR